MRQCHTDEPGYTASVTGYRGESEGITVLFFVPPPLLPASSSPPVQCWNNRTGQTLWSLHADVEGQGRYRLIDTKRLREKETGAEGVGAGLKMGQGEEGTPARKLYHFTKIVLEVLSYLSLNKFLLGY